MQKWVRINLIATAVFIALAMVFFVDGFFFLPPGGFAMLHIILAFGTLLSVLTGCVTGAAVLVMGFRKHRKILLAEAIVLLMISCLAYYVSVILMNM